MAGGCVCLTCDFVLWLESHTGVDEQPPAHQDRRIDRTIIWCLVSTVLRIRLDGLWLPMETGNKGQRCVSGSDASPTLTDIIK